METMVIVSNVQHVKCLKRSMMRAARLPWAMKRRRNMVEMVIMLQSVLKIAVNVVLTLIHVLDMTNRATCLAARIQQFRRTHPIVVNR